MVQHSVNGSGDVKQEVRHYWVYAIWHGWEESAIEASPTFLKQRDGYLWMPHV